MRNNKRLYTRPRTIGQTQTGNVASGILDILFPSESRPEGNNGGQPLFNVGVEFENQQLVKLGVTIFGSILLANFVGNLITKKKR